MLSGDRVASALDGQLGNVQLFGRALDSSEISDLATGLRVGLDSQIVYAPLTETDGTTVAHDLSGNGYDGVIHNMYTSGSGPTVTSRTVSYEYDDNGNRTTKTDSTEGASPATTVTSYDYDDDNRLLHAAVSVDSVLSLENTFAYDYRSRRYYRQTGAEENICVFDGGLSIREYDASSCGRTTTVQGTTPQVKYLRG